MYHHESLTEYHLLKTNTPEFFQSIFRDTYQDGYGKFFSTDNSWWNDLKGTFFVKALALFNLFSFGNYYVNVIFYSFITLFGGVAVFKVMQDKFPEKRLVVILTTFLIPSVIYWTSGLHKDGLIFLGLSLVVYHIYFALKENQLPVYRIIAIFVGLITILALRNFLIITVVPAVTAWVLAHKSKFRPSLVFAVLYSVFAIIFFTARYIHPRLDFPDAVVVKQGEFLQLKGGSTVPVTRLEPTVGSFVSNMPEALSLTVLRPYPSDVRHLLSLAAAVETCVFLLFFLIFLFVRKNGVQLSPFMLFCVFLAFSILLMIGYSVNVLGAIVRYRSIILPFLIVPMMAKIDWDRVIGLLADNINNKNNV